MNGPSSPAGYGAPPSQGFGRAPPSFGPPPQAQGYGAPPQAQGYGAPPQAQGYGAPPPQAYGAQGYGPASPYGAAPPPYGHVQYPGQAMPGMGMGMNTGVAPKNEGLAVALELLGGFFFQTFGIGHLYAGNVGVGLGLMFGYWVLTAINVVLCFLFIGFITWPITWLAFMVISAITANNAAKRANAKAMGLAF